MYTKLYVQRCWQCVVDYSLLFAVKSFLCSYIYVGVAFSLQRCNSWPFVLTHTVWFYCHHAEQIWICCSDHPIYGLYDVDHTISIQMQNVYSGFNKTCSIKLIFLWRDVWAYARKLTLQKLLLGTFFLGSMILFANKYLW